MTIKSLFFILILILTVSFSNIYADDFTLKVDTISEIVVEASKDRLKVNEIPAAISILSSKTINENNINTLSDITSVVPNLFMFDYGSKLTSPIYIRGIGSKINAPSVGLYVDNVPFFEKSVFAFDFFDIQRIEVLQGPQGTQYGRNAMGGIINITTKSPWNYQGSHIDLSAGTYGAYNLNAGYYGKPNDKFAYSLAINFKHNDGYFTNSFLNDKVDNLNSFGIRNRLIWKISERFYAENILSFETSKQGGYPYSLYNDSTKKAEKITYNQYSSYARNVLSDALVFKYNNQFFNLTATTAYQYFNDNQSIDQDFTKDSTYFAVQKQKQNMLSQEIRLNSNTKSKYSWLVGVYGFMQQFDNSVDVDVYKAKYAVLKQYNHILKGTAFYHESTLNDLFIKNLSATFGIRFDTETDKMTYKYDKITSAATTNLADTIYKPLNSFVITPKFSLNYKWKRNNVYAVVAKGYKTGGYNSSFWKPEDLTFKPENSWNYEIGARTSLFHNFLYAAASVFYIDWTNQQISQLAYNSFGVAQGYLLKNAGHSASKGFEITLKTNTFYGFELQTNYGLTNAKFISYVKDSTTNYSGNYIPFVPKHTFSFLAKKTIPLKSKILDKIVLNALYRGAGAIYWSEDNANKQNFYGILDGNISFVRRNIQFDIWGSNLTNSYYQAYFFMTSGKNYMQPGKPQQFGVKLSVNL